MVRKLLTLPNQPAVVLMNSYSWTWGGVSVQATMHAQTQSLDDTAYVSTQRYTRRPAYVPFA